MNDEPFNIGCEKCDKGRIKIFNKPIGYTTEFCDCYFQYEMLCQIFYNWGSSNLPFGIIKENPIAKYDEKVMSIEFMIEHLKAEKKNWLFFQGTAGTGKTFSAFTYCQIALAQEKKVFFVSVPALLDKFRPQTENYIQELVMTTCKTVDLLVLDDIGKQKDTQFVKERLFIILDHRNNERLHTIFTSNKKLDAVKDDLDEAIYSRIMGNLLNNEPIIFGGVDRRL